MGLKLDCPQCGERLRIDLASTQVECPSCGYRPSTGLDEKVAEIQAKGPRPNAVLRNPDQINARAASLFYTAHDHLFAGQKPEAMRALKDALDLQPDFLEAHLWMAKISDDVKVQRDHLGSILAYAPGDMEAMRMLMVLNGQMTAEQAARTYHFDDAQVRRVEEPVSVETRTLRCPNCKGDLTVDERTGMVKCRFCGYSGMVTRQQATGADSLMQALLLRKAESVRWVVGKRLLHCNDCGAERTLTDNQLSQRCPFCGSNHVIEQDALDSFEQPDGLVPFLITRDEAAERIKTQLKSVSERVKGWFDNNRIASASLSGYYLPYWVFDATFETTITRIVNKVGYYERNRIRPDQIHREQKQRDAIYDLAVCAVQSPPAALTRKLGEFDTGEMIAYDPQLLARYPAELYTMDFDAAALEARSWISKAMRERYGRSELADDDVTVNVFTIVEEMSFRLALMPVWVARLVEEDRDQRAALVNGQTGKVALGKAEKRG